MPRDRSRERERHDRHRHRHRSRSPKPRDKRKTEGADDEAERKQRRLERLAKWKKKQGVEESEQTADPTGGDRSEPKERVENGAEPPEAAPEVDALDAFMAAEVLPEVKAAAATFHSQKEKEKLDRAKAMAAGKKTKRPKFLDESDSDDDAHLDMEIPTNKVKLVVGPSGARISDIQKKSKCRVQIQKTEEEINRAFGSGSEPSKDSGGKTTTVLRIYGDARGVAIAQRLIEEAIENKEQKRQQRQREYQKKRETKNRDRQIYHLRHARDYDALGLPLGASKAEAKRAYRKLAVQFHPDKYQGDDKEAAQKRFLEIQRAYQSLMSTDEDQHVEQLGHR